MQNPPRSVKPTLSASTTNAHSTTTKFCETQRGQTHNDQKSRQTQQDKTHQDQEGLQSSAVVMTLHYTTGLLTARDISERGDWAGHTVCCGGPSLVQTHRAQWQPTVPRHTLLPTPSSVVRQSPPVSLRITVSTNRRIVWFMNRCSRPIPKRKIGIINPALFGDNESQKMTVSGTPIPDTRQVVLK